MAISAGNIILGSDMSFSAGVLAEASAVNTKIGTNAVTQGTLIEPVTTLSRRDIILNGDVASGFGLKGVGGNVSFSDKGSYLHLQGYQGGGSASVAGYLTLAIPLDGYWKTLVVETREVGDGAWAGLSTNTSNDSPSYAASVKLCNRRDSWTGRHTSSINVSGLNGTYYIAFRAKAWLTWDEYGTVYGAGGQMDIYNVYFTR